MNPLNLADVTTYVEQNIGTFHAKRLQSLSDLRLDLILRRKNPYLFKAKDILTCEALVKTLLDAHLSSQEETIFGEFLEGLAIFICGEVYGGRKSAVEGIDLEFVETDTLYLITIKSGPNWGNSSQINRMKDDFKKARRIYRTNNPSAHIVAINGCCYGKDNHPDKGDYFKYCGQRFWQFISGNADLYLEIIEPLGHNAQLKNEEFMAAYAQIVNRFSLEFAQRFSNNGIIDWATLLTFNSAAN
jgi:hypothetical protein